MRLITRSTLDGIACAVVFSTVENVVQIIYANPREIEDGTVEVNPLDAVVNLPYHRNAGIWFDHHEFASEHPDALPTVKGKRGPAPSCARLIVDHYNSPLTHRFDEFLAENNRIAQAHIQAREILNPTGWVLLAFTLDPTLGMEQFAGYANGIVSAIKGGATINHLLETPEVRGRINRYQLDFEDFKMEISNSSHLEGDVVVSDLRNIELLPAGNRFIIFALYPDAAAGIRIIPHPDNSKVAIKIAKSIFNRRCELNLGLLAAEYGGGGLDGAAGCLIPAEGADRTVAELIARLKG